MARRCFLLCLVLNAICGCNGRTSSTVAAEPADGPRDSYVVVSLVENDSPFVRAVDALVGRHRAFKVVVSPAEVETILPELQARQPEYVAFVVPPDVLDINLVNRVLTLATQVDDDPFVDFAYGFITGRDADATVGLVKASDPQRRRADPRIVQFGVGGGRMSRSLKQNAAWPLRGGAVPVTAWISKGDTDQTRDENVHQAGDGRSRSGSDHSAGVSRISHRTCRRPRSR